MKSRSRITCTRLARAMALVAGMACGNAWAQCGPLGSAAEYPLYATSNLSLGKSTVSNGTSEISVVKARLLAVRPRRSSRKR